MRDLHAAVQRLEEKVEGLEGAVEDNRSDVASLATEVYGGSSGPDFASDEAAEEFLQAGLDPSDLEDVEPSGKTGYTASDVRGVIAAQEDGGDQ